MFADFRHKNVLFEYSLALKLVKIKNWIFPFGSFFLNHSQTLRSEFQCSIFKNKKALGFLMFQRYKGFIRIQSSLSYHNIGSSLIYCIFRGYLTFTQTHKRYASSVCTKSFLRSFHKRKKYLEISLKMKSREHINTIDPFNIYCISRGYLTFPQKPQEVFKFRFD